MAKQNGVSKKLNQRELYRQKVAAAMPEVKALVAKHGRDAVNNCLTKIRLRDREVKRLNALKKELAEAEARLR